MWSNQKYVETCGPIKKKIMVPSNNVYKIYEWEIYQSGIIQAVIRMNIVNTERNKYQKEDTCNVRLDGGTYDVQFPKGSVTSVTHNTDLYFN